ncbi:MAG: methyltransferase domain-containing protein [Bacteroidota bacterium]
MEKAIGNKWVLTTDLGLEKWIEKEWTYLGFPKGAHFTPTPYNMRGNVILEMAGEAGEVEELIRGLRTIHRFYRLRHIITFDEVPQKPNLRAVFTQLDIPELKTSQGFRVSTIRDGNHSFDTFDILREAGAAFRELYDTKVDLHTYDTNIMVKWLEKAIWIGIERTPQSLVKRWERPFAHRAPIKANVAALLLYMVGLRPEASGKILDPFTGSGTILMEASALSSNLDIHGLEIIKKVYEGAKDNLRENELDERIIFKQGDARLLEREYPDDEFDYIVSNPPFGIKVGKRMNLFWLYQNFLVAASKVTHLNSRMALLLYRRQIFEDAVANEGNWEILSSDRLIMGKLHLHLTSLKRKNQDTI